MYFFGYYVHEKHYQYTYMFLGMTVMYYKELLPVLNAFGIFSYFFMTACNNNAGIHGVLLVFTIAHGYVCVKLMNLDSSIQREFVVKDKSSIIANFFKRFTDFLRYFKYGKFLWIYGAQFYIINVYNEISHISWIETYREIFLNKIPALFVFSMMMYIYALLYFLSTNQVIKPSTNKSTIDKSS